MSDHTVSHRGRSGTDGNNEKQNRLSPDQAAAAAAELRFALDVIGPGPATFFCGGPKAGTSEFPQAAARQKIRDRITELDAIAATTPEPWTFEPGDYCDRGPCIRPRHGDEVACTLGD